MTKETHQVNNETLTKLCSGIIDYTKITLLLGSEELRTILGLDRTQELSRQVLFNFCHDRLQRGLTQSVETGVINKLDVKASTEHHPSADKGMGKDKAKPSSPGSKR